MKFRAVVVAGTFVLLAVAAAAAAARADQLYTVDGSDVFTIGNGEVKSKTTYHGVQQLTIQQNAGATTYTAHVEYEKRGARNGNPLHADYATTVSPSGQQQDGPGHDPDYLSILNQPFAVQLDGPTMRDLAHVTRPVPFDFPSPITGAPLRGTLRRLPDAQINGARVMGIAFEAQGPLHGALPDRPAMALAGAITMRGTAFYAYDNALLLALDATLSIEGNIDDAARKAPVSIVYSRTIRPATDQQAARLGSGPVPHKTGG